MANRTERRKRVSQGNQSGKKRKWLRITRKNHVKTMVVYLGIILCMAGLCIRLIYIEHTQGAKYQKIVLAQQTYDSVTIPYRRGDILDRKGTVMATSMDVYNVILDCKVLTAKEDYLDPTIKALVSCFPALNETELRSYIEENPDSQYKVLLEQISYKKVEKFYALQREKDSNGELTENAGKIKGVWFEKEYIRKYPYKSLASSVLGFTTTGDVGMAGLENYYSDILNGTNGRQYGYLNSDNEVEKTIKEAIDGNDIISTLDLNIQTIVEEKISDFIKAYQDAYEVGPGAKHIGVIVENPNNGEILAMADYPNYDLSEPRSLEGYYSEDELKEMSDEEQLDALNELWQNFCISYTYEPGSTQKPLTVAAGLDSGKLSGKETYVCKGYEKVGDRQIFCVNRNGHGVETVENALMDSCNAALMQMVKVIGKETFCEYQSIFGMGVRTNIDLPGEARTDSLVRSLDETSAVDLATESFGQNYNCTMIQMVSAFSSLINGGNYYQPHVVSKITDENGNIEQQFGAELLKQTVSRATSEQIKEYLYSTVSDGTASLAKVPGYSMGGKTGTAEKQPRNTGKYLVSFIGYVPQNQPQIVIYVTVDEPNQSVLGGAQAHSNFAQNIAREILEEVLPYMNIFKDEVIKKDALMKEDTNMYTGISGYEAKAKLGESISYE